MRWLADAWAAITRHLCSGGNHVDGNLGTQGEDVAARFLQAAVLRIFDRRVRFPCGELDLIALDAETLVFCRSEDVTFRSSRYSKRSH